MDVLKRFYLTPYLTEEFYSEFFQRMDEAKKYIIAARQGTEVPHL